MGGTVADLVVTPASAGVLRTPDGISDEVACTLPVSGTAAALASIAVRAGDTVLVGGAAGGVGVFAVQLARLAAQG
jgi:NADPH:quinone reductase-like Zn-dependent oxidoreductase